VRKPPSAEHKREYPPPKQPFLFCVPSRLHLAFAARPWDIWNIGFKYDEHIESRNSAKRMIHMADFVRSAPRQVPKIKLSIFQAEHPMQMNASSVIRESPGISGLPPAP